MIFKDNKEIASVFKGNRAIIAIYKGSCLVWESIRSCFGKGFWNSDKPWNNDDGWKTK